MSIALIPFSGWFHLISCPGGVICLHGSCLLWVAHFFKGDSGGIIFFWCCGVLYACGRYAWAYQTWLDRKWIGTINKYMPTWLCHYMWIVTYMYINTKLPHAPSIHHKNENYQVTGPKLSVRQTKGTKLSSHLSTEKYKNVVGNSLYYARAFNPTMMVSLVKLVASQSKLTEDTN